MKKQLFCLLTSFLLNQILFAQRTIIYCGKLIDPKSLTVQTEMTILVSGNLVLEVQKGYSTAGSDDKQIDLKNRTVMPGLIDTHVHLEFQISRDYTLSQFYENPADIAIKSTVYAKRTLMAGFTTVRDLGGFTGVNIALRNAILKGIVPGPHVYTAGKYVSSTGGHGDQTDGYRQDLMGNPGPLQGIANGKDECIKAVRQRYKEGSDLIKIIASGGVLSMEKDGTAPQFSEEEMRTIVETAKDCGMRVAAHAHGAESIKRAIRAGVTSIEHGSFIDDEGIELAKKYGVWLVPTLIPGKSVADSAKIPGYYSARIAEKAMAIGPLRQANFSKAYKAGVKIAFGTDAGVYAHGKNWLEFIYMNESGMTPLETIRAATVSAAELIGISDKAGSIEKGKWADIVAVDGDPTQDIHVMGNIKFVMKEGIIYKNE
jgi:imidazolonepropionase-like amidohydrolase